jgi:hypothetical protein
MPDWYSFTRNGESLIGPFPLARFADQDPLHLVRPRGAAPSDFSRFHVFGTHYDLFLAFRDGRVWIEGSGRANVPPRKRPEEDGK